jgi:hypothetical protein
MRKSAAITALAAAIVMAVRNQFWAIRTQDPGGHVVPSRIGDPAVPTFAPT